MVRLFSILLVTLALGACSTVIEGQTQDVTIETPGTSGALCLMERPGYRTRVWAPKTVRITKSAGPMEVTCYAPGNRQKTVLIEPDAPSSFSYNILTGFLPGALYDRETGAMYLYPDTITVDFTGIKPERMPKPDYQRVLDENPDIFDMEEFRPGVPAMQRDRDYVQPELMPRRTNAELFSHESTSYSTGNAAPAPVTSSGQQPAAMPPSPMAGSTTEQLTRSMNPQVFGNDAQAQGSAYPVYPIP